jgi:hypothetical protein
MLPGATLCHEGQFEGRRIKVPVQLDERAPEPPDMSLQAFYHALTLEYHDPAYHDGLYMALAINPILHDDTGCRGLIAFAWAYGESVESWRVVIVNLTDHAVKGRVMLPLPELMRVLRWHLHDALNPELLVSYTGDELLVCGLPVELAPYQSHLLRLSADS